MKTLDREKSEKLFDKIQRLELYVSSLKGSIQNPDFVNKECAEENYKIFDGQYNMCLRILEEVKTEMFSLHKDLLN
jgi:hypothetical protein